MDKKHLKFIKAIEDLLELKKNKNITIQLLKKELIQTEV